MSGPIIFGAGLAGLIAARMLADQHPVVMEKQSDLPNNHKALLRFRNEEVSRATNIPFKKVAVIKSVTGYGDPIKDAIAYSLKVTGKLHARSVLDLDPVNRFIAPDDFISRLSATADIQFGKDFQQWSAALLKDHPPVISTLPMPVMMDLFEWPDKPEFTSHRGWTLKATIDPSLEPSLSCTVYNTHKSARFYRASITNGDVMFEGTGEAPRLTSSGEVLELAKVWADESFGYQMPDCIIGATMHEARYQKIADLTGRERESAKRFMMHLSDKHRIYSLGRFATWRPKLLLDDIPNDVRIISRLIDGESLYNQHNKV